MKMDGMINSLYANCEPKSGMNIEGRSTWHLLPSSFHLFVKTVTGYTYFGVASVHCLLKHILFQSTAYTTLWMTTCFKIQNLTYAKVTQD